MRIDLNLTCEFTATFKLSETELKSLDALAGYGTDEFLKCFYTHLGKAYLEPYEQGIRTIFDKIKEMRSTIHDIDVAKKTISELFQKK